MEHNAIIKKIKAKLGLFILLLNCLPATAQVEVTTFIKYKNYMIPIDVMVDPVTPTGFKAELTSAYEITISWNPHLASEQYTLMWKQPGQTQFQELYQGTSTTIIRRNLELGQYQFRVQACGSSVCPPWTSTATVVIEHPNDQDLDGVLDQNDECDNTQWGQLVDQNGCSDAQLDSDNDGISNALDLCLNTPSGVAVTARGCPPSTIDSDSDGVTNDLDACQQTASGDSVNHEGCSSADQGSADFDGDGISNSEDSYPLQHAYQCPIQ